jgi:hypothetical protein
LITDQRRGSEAQRGWDKISAILSLAVGAPTLLLLLLNHQRAGTIPTSLMGISWIMPGLFAAVMIAVAVLQYKAFALRRESAARPEDSPLLRIDGAEVVADVTAQTYPVKIYTEIFNNSGT